MKLKKFPKIAVSRHSNPVLILNYYDTPNESFRVESIVMMILIQQYLWNSNLCGIVGNVKKFNIKEGNKNCTCDGF